MSFDMKVRRIPLQFSFAFSSVKSFKSYASLCLGHRALAPKLILLARIIIISFLRTPHMHVSHLSVCRPYHEQFDTWLPSYNDQSSYMISLNITCHIANSVGWLEVSSWLFFFVHLFVWFFELYLVTHVFFQWIVRSFLLSSYCLDAYGSQLWPFHDKSAGKLFTTWRKTIRKLFLSST